LSVRLRIFRPVRLLESCLTDIPVVLGHFRPIILMPIGVLTGLPAQQIEAILVHELAHVSRCDYLINVLQRSAECLLFYHPALWWISRRVREERENCCDDLVVRIKGNPREYAFALAALEESRMPGYKPAVAATGGSVMKRVRRLLNPKRPSGSLAPVLAVLFFCATGALGIAAWAGGMQDSIATAQQQTNRPAGSGYEKWLNEDVVYIIDNAERSAFVKLTTDEERDKFIEQFWARRDPRPGTPENQFKEEHYRRIAYANKHFGSSVPGWRTDRGYMYIVYGPPDEIDAHPAGPSGMRSGYEEWMYRHIEAVGDNLYLTFIDRSGHGDYHLAPGNAR
jgi:GWxTD domain-containing protein